MLKIYFLHCATFTRYREVQAQPGRSSLSSSLLLHHLPQSDPGLLQSYLLMVIGLSWAAAAGCQFVDLGLGAGDALARKEDSATGEVALQARGRLHVNAQYYRISQVVSGVCSGRVGGEAAGQDRSPPRSLRSGTNAAVYCQRSATFMGHMLPRRVSTSNQGV